MRMLEVLFHFRRSIVSAGRKEVVKTSGKSLLCRTVAPKVRLRPRKNEPEKEGVATQTEPCIQTKPDVRKRELELKQTPSPEEPETTDSDAWSAVRRWKLLKWQGISDTDHDLEKNATSEEHDAQKPSDEDLGNEEKEDTEEQDGEEKDDKEKLYGEEQEDEEPDVEEKTRRSWNEEATAVGQVPGP